MKFNKNEFGWKEKVSVNTNLNNDTFNIKFLPDMNISSKIYAVNAVNLEEKTIYKINTNINKKYLAIRYIFSDGTFKNLYNLSSMYLSGKVEIYISRKTDTLIEFDVDYIRYTCNIDEVNKTVEITKKALILGTDNKQEYTPTKDYHPTTKKYVDDKFIMDKNIETIYTIPMSEMQKCNNGTSMYVSSIDFDELFINHEKNIYYANYKDETLIPVTYDSAYNRFVTGVLDDLGSVNIALGFDLGTHKMYPFNGGMAGVKAYQFTNDLIIKRVPILNVNEVATKKYVDDKSILEPLPIHTTNESASSILYIVNIMDLDKRKTYGAVQYGIDKGTTYRFVYICDDGTQAMIATFGDGVNENPFRVWHYTNSSVLYYGGYYYNIDYTNHATRTDVVVTKRIQKYLNLYNTTEYTPEEDYNPATKKYVDDSIANQPQISFNDSGELVVTINGVSKTFVPKPE